MNLFRRNKKIEESPASEIPASEASVSEMPVSETSSSEMPSSEAPASNISATERHTSETSASSISAPAEHISETSVSNISATAEHISETSASSISATDGHISETSVSNISTTAEHISETFASNISAPAEHISEAPVSEMPASEASATPVAVATAETSTSEVSISETSAPEMPASGTSMDTETAVHTTENKEFTSNFLQNLSNEAATQSSSPTEYTSGDSNPAEKPSTVDSNQSSEETAQSKEPQEPMADASSEETTQSQEPQETMADASSEEMTQNQPSQEPMADASSEENDQNHDSLVAQTSEESNKLSENQADPESTLNTEPNNIEANQESNSLESNQEADSLESSDTSQESAANHETNSSETSDASQESATNHETNSSETSETSETTELDQKTHEEPKSQELRAALAGLESEKKSTEHDSIDDESKQDSNEIVAEQETSETTAGQEQHELSTDTQENNPAKEQEMELESISPQIVRILPEKFIKKHHILPIEITKTTFKVAMSDIDDLKLGEEIRLKVGLRPELVKYPMDDIKRAINNFFGVEKSTIQALVDLRVKKRLEALASEVEEEEEFEFVSVDQPVVKLLNSILEGAIVKKASDIHIEPQEPEMRVRYRIDGTLIEMMTIPHQIENALVSRAKIISNMDITEKRRPQDGHYSHMFKGEKYDMRFSCIPTVKGEKMVLRILDKSRMSLGLSQLGFSERAENQLKRLVESPYGMVFVTGPTGSGKTTSLYSMLNLLDRDTNNIATAEDPVEYRLSGINQTQVNAKIGLNFSGALRSFLRQDPDIIMVGEVRDFETAEISVQAALTGHLVLSTLHTNDASSAVTRLIDMGIEPFLIASTLVGVIAQRLARKLCTKCLGEGCNVCHNTGLSGRTVIYEVLEITEPIRQLITQNVSATEIQKAMASEGMITFKECGEEKVRNGICTPEEVRSIIGDF